MKILELLWFEHSRKLSNWDETKMVTFYNLFFLFTYFFFIRVFVHGHWQLTGQQGKVGDLFLFHSTTSTRSRTFRHLCATLHLRWLSHIFNCNACIYQTATRWDLPPYWITVRINISRLKSNLFCNCNAITLKKKHSKRSVWIS